MRRGLLLVLFLLPMSAAAASEDIIPTDPWEIIHLAREFGVADVGRDSMNDPIIEVAVEDASYKIVFYGCQLGRKCTAILFRAIMDRDEWEERPPEADAFLDWNREKLFGRAYLDEEGRAVLEHPVVLASGAPAEMLRATFERWHLALDDFAEHLD